MRFRFTDVTAESGIQMVITCGRLPTTEILEVNGGGLGLIDFNNNGRFDLFVANGATMDDPENGPGCRLFENISDPPSPSAPVSSSAIRFDDVTAQARINITRWAMGVAVGDYDGDGFDDIYIACYGPNVLLRNNGDGTFTDVTEQAFGDVAVRRSGDIPEWTSSAAFGDLNNNGRLDLYVCNYLDFDLDHRPARARYKGVEVMGGPHGLPPQHDVLYENIGGAFRDVSDSAGIRAARPSFGLNAVIIDHDGDGWQDINVANDSMPDFLFHNLSDVGWATPTSEAHGVPMVGNAHPTRSPIRFNEIGVLSGLAANADGGNQASMGVAMADVNGDGLPDKFTTVFSSDVNALHVSAGPLLYEDRAQQYGLAMISRPYLGWSAGFFDFNHSGHEDLLFVNGHVYAQATMELMDSEYQQPPLLFERDGPRFRRVPPEVGGDWLAAKHRDRNAVFADLDGDGDIDIIIGELNGPIRVLRNDLIGGPAHSNTGESPPDNGWLIVELKDDRPGSGNHRGLGAKIELIAGDALQTRWLFTGGGFQSSGAHSAHFGLGERPGTNPLQLTVTWPDGVVQRLEGVQPNQHLLIRRSDARE